MKSILKITFVAFVLFSVACDTYPSWDKYVEYSDTYPVSGDYLVRDFDIDADTAITGDWYALYIYNKSYNPNKDSVWVDNTSGHPATGQTVYPYRFKIKTKIDKDNLSFDAAKTGSVSGAEANPKDSCIYVSISNSKIIDRSDDITNAEVDSISFDFTYYNVDGVEVKKIRVKGHRRTGWENPQNDDAM